jgi:ribosomal protein S18 acetylase RimI-like enzyme
VSTRTDVEIDSIASVTLELEVAIARLLPQLSSAALPSRAALAQIVDSPGSRLLVARVKGRIAGMLTLVLYRIPTGVRARIEDVVVDASARGRGIGEALTRAALAMAADRGARSVDLTTRSTREAANRLYERIGFRRHDTNAFRYVLDVGEPPRG